MFHAKFDDKGREVPDPTPIALPGGWDRPESIQDQIKRFVRLEMSRQAEAGGFESFEEADDFDIDDEGGDFVSPYEVVDMVPEALGGVDPDGPGGDSQAPKKTAPEAATQAPGPSVKAVETPPAQS